ncbi:hypothetical protein O3W44_24465 [Pantoea sp. LMR881]|uniref:3-oxoacyl-[acyl-carrier-protein] synthase III C-terminal domain-containing protein n=1 Tax=Pantoea sp. LMR881 TaxID=3014336 RepID=UPI0022AF287C|nr:3-oxoacyl-[acyl-carrier-protein] synthase III C-terminal domain-containing protein [Pantoea sp. LMR881]MCZ4061617.1 hypothetical protein [Pantoea sp. LMR881]
MKKTGLTAADFHHVILQQPTIATLRSTSHRLGLNKAQLAYSRYASTTGDIGAASPLLGLARVLNNAKPDERILIVSYGFGAGSDAIALTVTEEILIYPDISTAMNSSCLLSNLWITAPLQI